MGLCNSLLYHARIRYENTYDMRGVFHRCRKYNTYQLLTLISKCRHLNFYDLLVQKIYIRPRNA